MNKVKKSLERLTSLLLAIVIVASGFVFPEKSYADYAESGYEYLLDGDGDVLVKLPNLIGSNAGVSKVDLMNGWHIAASEGNLYCFVVSKNGSYTGQIGYCIAPGVQIPAQNAYKVKSAEYVAQVAAQNPLLSEAQLSYLMSLVLGYGYNGKFDRDMQNNKAYYEMFGKIWATQVLVWEVVVGERDASFGYVAPTGGKGACKDCIKSTNPIYSYFTASYKEIEQEVKNTFLNPSFATESESKTSANTYKLGYANGKYTLTLTDNNGVLGKYTAVTNNADVTASINGNTLTLTSDKPVTTDVKVTFTRAISHKSFVILGKNGQDFTTVKANGSGAWQSVMVPISGEAQKNAYIYLEQSQGEVLLTKVSANPDCTGNNPNYSLAGAVYGVYSSGNVQRKTVDTNTLVGKITTDENGKGNLLTGLSAGTTYYVKEISPSKGYLLDENVYAVTPEGTGAKAAVVTSVEKPVNDPISIRISKESSDEIENEASLAGTQFTIKYYAVDVSKAYTADQLAAMRATRTWVIEAFAQQYSSSVMYIASLEAECLVEGSDALFYSETGNATLPVGYFTIQETKAAPGYIKDSGTIKVGGQVVANGGEAIVGWVDENGEINPISLKVSNEYYASNAPIMGGFTVAKYDGKTEKKIESEELVTFELYNTNDYSVKVGETEVAAGEKVGTYSFKANESYSSGVVLPYGSYKLVETAAPKGYLLSGRTEIKFSITENNQVVDLTGFDKAFVDYPDEGNVIVKKDAEDGVIEGIKFTLEGTSKYGEKISLTAVTNAQGIAEFKNVPASDDKGYTVSEVDAPYRYIVTASQNVKVTSGSSETLTFTNNLKKGKIEIYKTGDIFSAVEETEGGYRFVYKNTYLAGAVFEIRAAEDVVLADGTKVYAKGDLVETITTTNTGKSTSKDLYFGKYIVKEVRAPKGYVLDEKTYEITLEPTADNFTIETVSVNNVRNKVKISLTKQLEEDDVFGIGKNGELANVKFGLFATEDIAATDGSKVAKDALIEEIGVNADGTASFAADLPCGTYYVKETATDPHYILSSKTYEVAFSGNSTTETVEFFLNNGEPIVNELIRGSVKGLKKDDSGNVLAGAEFGLFEEESEDPILTSASDENGVFEFKDLPYGSYTVKETKSPEGYLLDTKEYEIEIGEDEVLVNIEIVNTLIRGNIVGTKKGDDGKLLEGVQIGLFRNGELLTSTVTDKDGIFRFENIPYGEYEVKEIKAIEGYLISEKSYPAVISENKQVILIEIVDTLIRADLKLVKVDLEDTSIQLSGAIFDVFKDVNKDGKIDPEDPYVGTMQEEEEGVYFLRSLPYGEYLVRETKAPKHFKADENIYKASVKEHGATIVIANTQNGLFVNAHDYGRVEFFAPIVDTSFGKGAAVSPLTGENIALYLILAASLLGLAFALVKTKKKGVITALSILLMAGCIGVIGAEKVYAAEEPQTIEVTVESYDKEDVEAVKAKLAEMGYKDIDIQDIKFEVVSTLTGEKKVVIVRGLASKEDAKKYLTNDDGLTADFDEIIFTEKYRTPASGYYDTAADAEVPKTRTVKITQNGETFEVILKLISSEDMEKEEEREAVFTAKFYDDFNEFKLGDRVIKVTDESPCFEGFETAILEILGLDPETTTISGGSWGEIVTEGGESYRTAVYTGTQKVTIPFVRSYYEEDADNPDRPHPSTFDAEITYTNGVEEGKEKYTLKGTVTYINNPGTGTGAQKNAASEGFFTGKRVILLVCILALLGIFFDLKKKNEKQ